MPKNHIIKNENNIKVVIHTDKLKKRKRKGSTKRGSKKSLSLALGNPEQRKPISIFNHESQTSLNNLAHNYVAHDNRYAMPSAPRIEYQTLNEMVKPKIEYPRLIQDAETPPVPNQNGKKQYKTVAKTGHEGFDSLTLKQLIAKRDELKLSKKLRTKGDILTALRGLLPTREPVINKSSESSNSSFSSVSSDSDNLEHPDLYGGFGGEGYFENESPMRNDQAQNGGNTLLKKVRIKVAKKI